MKRLMLLGGILLGGGLSLALACSCGPIPPPKEAFADAAAVFSGRVDSIEPPQTSPYIKVTLRVLQSWKGTNAEILIVYTENAGFACGYNFAKGEEYLVYAGLEDVTSKNKMELVTGMCVRNSRLVDALEDLRFLGVGRKPAKI